MPLNRPSGIPLIAHRGESHDAPENTLAAFAIAWQRGDEAIELDVHLTADRRLIVSHDADTERMLGRKLVIAEQPLAKLQQIGLPTLEEVLAQMPEGKRAFVEIKVGPEALEPLSNVLANHPHPARDIVIISFDLQTVRAAKQRLPQHEAYLLIEQKQDEKTGRWRPVPSEMIAQALDARADGLDIGFNLSIDQHLIDQAHAAGLKLLVWTIDDPAIARRMIGLGVDGITTNRAAWLREQLERDDTR